MFIFWNICLTALLFYSVSVNANFMVLTGNCSLNAHLAKDLEEREKFYSGPVHKVHSINTSTA
jgi:hypothetical protein